jgi:hypothetical protein
MYPKFQASEYNYPSFESKREHAGAVIFCQGHYSQENGDTSAESEMCETNCVKRVQ